MSDLVERLRSPEVFIDTGGFFSPTAQEAAARIEALEAENARLRAEIREQFEANEEALDLLGKGFRESAESRLESAVAFRRARAALEAAAIRNLEDAP